MGDRPEDARCADAFRCEDARRQLAVSFSRFPFHTPVLRTKEFSRIFTRFAGMNRTRVRVGYKLGPSNFLRWYSAAWKNFHHQPGGSGRADFEKSDGSGGSSFVSIPLFLHAATWFFGQSSPHRGTKRVASMLFRDRSNSA